MRLVLAFCLSAMLTSVAPARTYAQHAGATRTSGPLADSLRAFAFRMADLLRRMDADGVLDLYGDHEHLVHIEEGRAIPWAVLSTMIPRYFATAASNPVYVVGEPGVVLMDGDHAVIHVEHRMSAVGGRPAHQGMWTGVLRRYPEGWKIVHSHSSEPKP